MNKGVKDDQSVKTIVAQIDSTRDLDAETSKPKLHNSTKQKTPPKKEELTKDVAPPKKAVNPEPTKSQLQQLLTPYLRYPLTGIPRTPISKFVPSAFNMYYIVHLMDEVIRKNGYFKRQQDAWHPFVSRLYFGVIFIIQTIRTEIAAGVASKARRNFYSKFVKN